MKNFLKMCAGLSFVLLITGLVACGGGGGGGPAGSTDVVVYRADQQVDRIQELYLGGSGSRLSPALGSGMNVGRYELTPDRQTVVYIADEQGPNELYRVDLANPGASTKISGPLVAGGSVRALSISPDGSQVAYMADADIVGIPEIYLVNLDGSGLQKINGSVGSTPSVFLSIDSDNTWSPDGRYILQSVISIPSNLILGLNVFDTTLGAANSTRITPALVANGSVSQYGISSDSASVVYIADQATDNTRELFRVTLANPGVSNRISKTLVSNGDVGSFAIAPNGARVAYSADADTVGISEVYLAGIDGSNHQKINGTVGSTGTIRVDLTPNNTWSADGRYIVQHVTDDFVPIGLNVYDTTLGVANSTRITPPLVANGRLFTEDYVISPDSKTVAYAAQQDTPGVSELYRVDLATPTVSTKLNPALVTGGNVFELRFTANSSSLVYLAQQDTDTVNELYQVALANPGVSTKLNGPLVAGGDVSADFIVK